MNLARRIYLKRVMERQVIEGSCKKIVSFGVLLFLVLFPLAGEPPLLSVDSLGAKGWKLTYQNVEDPRILENIDLGLTAEIIYDIRVYRDPFTFMSFRGGSLVMSERVVVEGRWDRFNGHYTIVQMGKTERFSSAEDFRRQFFSLRDWHFDFPLEAEADYEVMVRSRIIPMRLYPPFNILASLQELLEKRNPWFQLPLEGES